MDALFGGAEPLLDRSALGDSHASRQQRYWLLQDIQTLLEKSALRQPILICLDDLQMGTAAHGPRYAPCRPAWLLCRSAGCWPSDPSRRATIWGAPSPSCFATAGRRRLGASRANAVAEIATDVLGAAPDDSLLALADGARGNPFFLRQLLRTWREEHLVSFDAGRATLVEALAPAPDARACADVLARMSPGARNVAAVAASMDAGSPWPSSPRSSRCLPRPCSTPFQELIGSELLAEGGEMLSFTHDLNREAVRASQPSSAVHALDRQVASALLAAGALPVSPPSSPPAPRRATRSPSPR